MVSLLERAAYWREVLFRPTWAIVFVGGFGFVGGLLTWRDELLPDSLKERFRVLKMLPHRDWGWWALVISLLIICVVLESSYRLNRRLKAENDAHDLQKQFIDAQRAHTEELRQQRVLRDQENSTGFRLAQKMRDRLIEGIHAPPKQAPPARKYLRPDAEYLTVALREIQNVLTESVRDSTTLPGWFDGLGNASVGNLTLPVVQQIRQKLQELDMFYRQTDMDVSAILTRDRSYLSELSQYTGSITLHADYLDFMSEFQNLVSSETNKQGQIDSNYSNVIRGYARKVANQYRERWRRRVEDIKKIEAKLADIRANTD
jgi:hypothetical protein